MNTATPPSQISRSMVLLLAFAVGVIAANLYYAQPLIALIAKALGLQPEAAGLIVTLTQMGYGLGVLSLVPLGDLVENKKLILTLMAFAILALFGMAWADEVVLYFISAFAMGIGACAVQIVIPFAAHLSPEATRGRVVGNLMSGLMLGIMLSRPAASLLTDLFSWHAVFYLSIGLMIFLAILLYKFLPRREPADLGLRYTSLIGSMVQLFLRTPLLRRRAFYQACMFGAFCLFWTASPLVLAGPDFKLSQTAIALFALAGVAGAIVAPLAGRFADRGWTRAGTIISMVSGIAAFALTHLVPLGSTLSLSLLVIGAILLDAGVTANLVLGQRAIFSLRAKYRSRLNGLFLATIFVGGAAGSSLGAWAFARGGWELTSWVGAAFPVVALIYFGTEWLTGFDKIYSRRRR